VSDSIEIETPAIVVAAVAQLKAEVEALRAERAALLEKAGQRDAIAEALAIIAEPMIDPKNPDMEAQERINIARRALSPTSAPSGAPRRVTHVEILRDPCAECECRTEEGYLCDCKCHDDADGTPSGAATKETK